MKKVKPFPFRFTFLLFHERNGSIDAEMTCDVVGFCDFCYGMEIAGERLAIPGFYFVFGFGERF